LWALTQGLFDFLRKGLKCGEQGTGRQKTQKIAAQAWT
jgi:hypothetical protein